MQQYGGQMACKVACLNMTAKDWNVYESVNQQKTIVGTITPPHLDFALIDKTKVEITPHRECQIEHGEDRIMWKGGQFPYNPCDIYISDNFWLVCNFSCPYCLTDSPEFTAAKDKFIIKADTKLKFLSYLTDNMASRKEHYHYRIFGGEPTIYPRFEDVVSHLDQDPWCSRVIISTNASLDDKIDLLCDCTQNKTKIEVNVSVHPLDAKFDWSKTKSRIRKMYDCGFGLYTIGVITDLTKDTLLTMSEELKKEMGFGINLFHNLRPEKMRG